MRILIIEDDPDIHQLIHDKLEQEGFICDVCEDGADASAFLSQGTYNAVLLDRLLPHVNGMKILQKMREVGDQTPVLMLTALDTIPDRTEGLNAGADDYLVKPFDMTELIARVNALLRRPPQMKSATYLTFQDLELDPRQCILRCKGKTMTLSRKETAVLETLVENAGKILSRSELLSMVWGFDDIVEEGNVDNYIFFLRRRLKAIESETVIRTVHGVGYRLLKNDKEE